MSTTPAPTSPPAPTAPAPANPAPSTEQTFSAVSLAKYRQAFGDKGTDWLLAGKSFEECEKLHANETAAALAAENEALKKTHAEQLAAANKERDEAVAKLNSLSLGGENEPTSFGGQDTPPAPTPNPMTNALGERMGKYAETLKLKGSAK